VNFEPVDLTDAELALQGEIRAFLEAELPRGSFEPGLGMGGPKDAAFSQRLAARGWVGMSLPRRYGGGDRAAVERFIVVEELLRWGAPVAHHWFADRQSGPLIARVGTEDQKERFLPAICRGELSFCVGMSEPDSGSDLASVKSRAERCSGGYLVNGTKVWTTGAHHHDWMITLVRTAEGSVRSEGLSQLLIDLRAPGVTVRSIPFLDGTADFNEVVLSDVFVPEEDRIGIEGNGWAQSASELAFERGGPDRWLSTFLVLEQFLREHPRAGSDPELVEFVGAATARWWGLRNMSLAVARGIDMGLSVAAEAALVKEMGTRFELDVLEELRELVELEPSPGSDSLFERLLVTAILTSPSFTIRGGTIEILRSVAAKGLRA